MDPKASGRVLVVDDEEDLGRILKFALAAAGHEVLLALDGSEGLRMAREESPDLILLDLMLPKIDGYKVCRMLKFDERYRHIPVVILSARTQEVDKKMAQETGADLFITKPYNLNEILGAIHQLLQTSPTYLKKAS
ncbi:MAG TPA: response regulator [Candidatus Saccharimonadales bacterium]|nr:response regulator [Candidatus Saccharimonadales bacterium]